MYQIGDYIGDKTWTWQCADQSEKAYRDGYAIPNNYRLQLHKYFNKGLLDDWKKTGDTTSRDACIGLSDNEGAAWRLDFCLTTDLTRECAYVVENDLTAELCGAPPKERTRTYVDILLGYADQWFITRNASYHKPFMMGLWAEALIQYYDQKEADPRIPYFLQLVADKMWEELWVPADGRFKYISPDYGGETDIPESVNLNLLIAPMYSWLYLKNGEVRNRDRGDEVFLNGVQKGYLARGKEFSQNYRWSFEFVKWRELANQYASGILPTPVPPTDGGQTQPTPVPTVTPSATPTPRTKIRQPRVKKNGTTLIWAAVSEATAYTVYREATAAAFKTVKGVTSAKTLNKNRLQIVAKTKATRYKIPVTKRKYTYCVAARDSFGGETDCVVPQ